MSTSELDDSVTIDAPVERVWGLVSDVTRMAEWSPQVDSTRLRKGFDTIEVGTQFTNRNSQDDLTWTTHAEIVRLETSHEIAFRIEENWVIWSFTVEADGEGTLLTQRRETPDGISQQSLDWTEEHLGGVSSFTEGMRGGMRTTLDAIKAAAEA